MELRCFLAASNYSIRHNQLSCVWDQCIKRSAISKLQITGGVRTFYTWLFIGIAHISTPGLQQHGRLIQGMLSLLHVVV